MAAGAAGQPGDQSPRFVWRATSMALSHKSSLHIAAISHAIALQPRAPSSLCRLGPRLLGHADDDARPFTVRRADVGIYVRSLARGRARSHRVFWRGL